MLTVKQVAAFLKIHPNTVYRLPLRVHRLGRGRRYKLSELHEFIEGCREE